MQRRDLLALGGAAALLGGGKALAQAAAAAGTDAKVTRIYSTADGESHVEDLVISPDAGPVPVTSMSAGLG